jgi:hypothetical protein
MAMSYKDALLSNMVAGNIGVGAGRFGGVPKFDESDFDGWVLFMKASLRKFDRADLALTDPMPRKEVDDDGEEVDFSDSDDEELFQKKLTKWSTRNDQAYSLIMEACLNHPSAKLVAKAHPEPDAASLLKHLGERFKIIQQSVKQSEISKFNNMVMEAGETCSTFVD